MKKLVLMILGCMCLIGCTSNQAVIQKDDSNAVLIELSDEQILIDGSTESQSVSLDKKIIYYEDGKDETYGEGSKEDEHSLQEAELHTVVTIHQPGIYRVSGKLSYGQIAIDLGENAIKDPEAVVVLILDNVDLTCTVAPAIIVYNAYECAESTKDHPTKQVDLTGAGFHLVLEKDSINNIQGAYVAKIYQPETEEKLHKYDAAIESLVSLNITGTGTLNLTAQNEGIETKMHMHIHSGNLNISSADDSLNAGEDGVSVIRISDGVVVCDSNLGNEGDGIDSNGWLIIEGGTVVAYANEKSQDSGIDSDNGIIIDGGNVLATGNMLDQISQESLQHVMVLQSMTPFDKDTVLVLKQDEQSVTALKSSADWSVLVYSSDELKEADYTLWEASEVQGQWVSGLMMNPDSVTLETQLSHSGMQKGQGNHQPMGMMNPEGIEHPEGFDPEQHPEGWREEDFGKHPQTGFVPGPMQGNMEILEGSEQEIQNRPDYQFGKLDSSQSSTVFTLRKNQYMFIITNLK
ncbi:MAG: carbohydrate-binding domain-containing protein [Erysipelotrichaceae bacterium]|nr:carbohydrate-binding domain-containing protein [Erysipelotrichaceae bacterium]